jgi:NADH-quinone oxidoreductase subunit C
MADDPTTPEPPAPPIAAGDKPASAAPAEPLKAEVSRTEAAGSGASAAATPAGKPATPAAATPAVPAASPTAAAAAKPAVVAAGAKPAVAAAAKPAVAAGAKPAAAAGAKPAAAAKPAAEHPPKASAPTGPVEQAPPADLAVPGFIVNLQAAMPGAVTHISYWVGDWTVIVTDDKILEVMRYLVAAPDAAFDLCSDVTAVDWPPRAERFDVVYCLFSTRHRQRVRVKARLADNKPIASVTSIWPAANWLEREVFDMFGIQFAGHPDLRRILMPDDWQGFPQRKDYPLEGPGELLMENPLDWLKLRQAKEEADIE